MVLGGEVRGRPMRWDLHYADIKIDLCDLGGDMHFLRGPGRNCGPSPLLVRDMCIRGMSLHRSVLWWLVLDCLRILLHYRTKRDMIFGRPAPFSGVVSQHQCLTPQLFLLG